MTKGVACVFPAQHFPEATVHIVLRRFRHRIKRLRIHKVAEGITQQPRLEVQVEIARLRLLLFQARLRLADFFREIVGAALLNTHVFRGGVEPLLCGAEGLVGLKQLD